MPFVEPDLPIPLYGGREGAVLAYVYSRILQKWFYLDQAERPPQDSHTASKGKCFSPYYVQYRTVHSLSSICSERTGIQWLSSCRVPYWARKKSWCSPMRSSFLPGLNIIVGMILRVWRGYGIIHFSIQNTGLQNFTSICVCVWWAGEQEEEEGEAGEEQDLARKISTASIKSDTDAAELHFSESWFHRQANQILS
jgi:hypothetical protein